MMKKITKNLQEIIFIHLFGQTNRLQEKMFGGDKK